MTENLVQFEAEIVSLTEIRFRVIWPQSEGPWVEGAMEDLIVHFTHAGWTAFNMRCALSIALHSKDESLGRSISDLLNRIISSMGAAQMADIRLSAGAMAELKRDHIDP